MKKITLLLFLFVFISSTKSFSQNNSKMDFRFGTGYSFFTSGDLRTYFLDNQLDYKLNNYFTSSLSTKFGKSKNREDMSFSFFQGDINILISPFRNNKRYDFKVGTGLTYHTNTESRIYGVHWINGELVEEDFYIKHVNSFGIPIVVDNSFKITNKFVIGFKTFLNLYFNEVVNYGATINIGMSI